MKIPVFLAIFFAVLGISAMTVEELQDAVETHPLRQPYAFAGLLPGDALTLADAGVAFYRIQVAPEAGETGEFAALELARYLQAVTGAEFAIGDASGEAMPTLKLALAPERKKMDGFRSFSDSEGNIVIQGDNERSLLYGVYDFLEKAAGIRWLSPQDYGTVIPRKERFTVPRFEDSSASSMSYRCNSSYYASPSTPENDADWMVKNRFNVAVENGPEANTVFYRRRGGTLKRQGYCHNFQVYLKPEKYFADHPEYFCFNRATGKWQAENAQICTSNSETVKIIAALADEFFHANPDTDYFPLMQEDGARLWCQCPECLAVAPNGDNTKYATDNNIYLANAVCREIQKTRPECGVVTFAYSVTQRPPERVLPLPGVRIVYTFGAEAHPGQMPWEAKLSVPMLLKWLALLKGNVVFYGYCYQNPMYQQINNEDAYIAIFRLFTLQGCQASNQECYNQWAGLDAYFKYLGARLVWDPWFDTQAFKADYFHSLYGNAAPPMLSYHELLKSTLSDLAILLPVSYAKWPSVPTTVSARLAEYLQQAEVLAGGEPRVLAAVAAQRRHWEFLNAFSDAVRALSAFSAAPDEPKRQRMTAAIKHAELVADGLRSDHLVFPFVEERFREWYHQIEAMEREIAGQKE